MITTTSYSNGGRILSIFKMDMKKLKNTMILFAVLYFVFFSLQYIMTLNKAIQFNYYSYELDIYKVNIYTPQSIFFMVPLVVFMPLVVVTTLFDYLHSKRAVDVYHSLPATRGQMMTGHILAGVTVMAVSLLVNYLLIFIAQLFMLGSVQFFAKNITDFLMLLFISYSLFIISIAVAVSVGQRRHVRLFALNTYVLPVVIATVVMGLFSVFYYGYTANWQVLIKLNPAPLFVLKNLLFYYRHFSSEGAFSAEEYTYFSKIYGTTLLLWVVLTVLITVLAYFLYKKRKSEVAETFNPRSGLMLVNRFAQTFLISLLMAFLFQGIFGYMDFSYRDAAFNYSYLYFGALLGAVLSYMVSEVIMARGFKTIKRALVPCAACTVLCIGFLASLTSPTGFGFITNVPNATAVNSVKINHLGAGYYYSETEYNYDYYNYNELFDVLEEESIVLTDPEAIRLVTQIHQDIVKSHTQDTSNTNYRYSSYTLNLEYNRKIGGRLRRAYTYYEFSDIIPWVNLEYNRDFLNQTHPLFFANSKNIFKVEFQNIFGENRKVLTLSSADIDALLQANRDDLAAHTAEKIMGNQNEKAVGYLMFTFRDLAHGGDVYRSFQLLVEPGFTNTIAFLQEKGFGDAMQVDLERVASAQMSEGYSSYTFQTPLRLTEIDPYNYNYGDEYTVFTGEEIEELYTIGSTNATLMENIYNIQFFDEDGYEVCTLYIDAEEIPTTLLVKMEEWEQSYYDNYYYEDNYEDYDDDYYYDDYDYEEYYEEYSNGRNGAA